MISPLAQMQQQRNPESATEALPPQQPDAVASEEKTNTTDRSEPVQEQPKRNGLTEWLALVIVLCGLKALLWHWVLLFLRE